MRGWVAGILLWLILAVSSTGGQSQDCYPQTEPWDGAEWKYTGRIVCIGD